MSLSLAADVASAESVCRRRPLRHFKVFRASPILFWQGSARLLWRTTHGNDRSALPCRRAVPCRRPDAVGRLVPIGANPAAIGGTRRVTPISGKVVYSWAYASSDVRSSRLFISGIARGVFDGL